MDRPRRETRPPQRYCEADLVAYALSVVEVIDVSGKPLTCSEALSHVDSNKWIVSLYDKIESL